MFIAAIVHDFEHTGTSNNFHIQSRSARQKTKFLLTSKDFFFFSAFRSDVALIYNDRAVLENHHVSAAFRLMRLDDYNILAEFSPEEYKFDVGGNFSSVFVFNEFFFLLRNFRHLVIEMVLATDMSSHFTQLKTMKTFLSMPEKFEIGRSNFFQSRKKSFFFSFSVLKSPKLWRWFFIRLTSVIQGNPGRFIMHGRSR